MNCGRVSNQLSAYVDRELTGMEMLQIRSHLNGCDRCHAEYEALHRMKMLLGGLPSVEPPPGFVHAAVQRLASSGARPSGFLPGRGRWRAESVSHRLRRLAANSGPFPDLGAGMPDARRLARRALDAIPWPRLTLGLTTAALAAALIFTNVVLRRHSDTLVASTPAMVLEGRPDQLETPRFFSETPADSTLRDVARDGLPEGQPSLPWVNVSLQSESSWTFR